MSVYLHKEPAEEIQPRPFRAVTERSIIYTNSGVTAAVPYQGQVWASDLTAHTTFSGIPQSNGMILLEQNPALTPFQARGYAWDPGWFHEARNTAQIEGPMEEMVSAVEATPIQMSFDEIPPHLQKYEASFARHREWARRVWHEWTRPGNDWVRWFAQQAMRATPWYGFYLGEVTAEEQWWQLEGDPFLRKYYIPKPPRWIAPWSVYRWVTHGDNLVGVALQTSQETDSYGYNGSAYTVLPAEKFLHIAARPMGPNWEGRSHFRSSYQLIKMLRNAIQVEALGHEVHGIGMVHVEEPPNNALTEAQRREMDANFMNAKSSHVPYFRSANGCKVNILSPASQLKEMGGQIGRLTQSIMMGIGAEGKLIGMTAGSNAARSSASEDAWRPFTSIAHNYVVEPMSRLFSRLLRYNFPEDRVFQEPRLTIGAVEKTNANDIIAGLAQAKTTGLLDHPVTRSIIADALGVDLNAYESSVSGASEGAGV